ncbi:hypothetical protein B0H19DRAFT_1380987 [Mycena capillaripes]|nr:hypothetical protein B0H19DRAFT_1380987 [Mycena capillaripes]
MSEHPFPPPHTTLGAVEIGLVFSTFFFGLETLQVFNYYQRFPKDSLSLKLLVAAVWWAGVGHSICAWHGFYLITISFYGQPAHILNPPNSLEWIALFSGIIGQLVEGFFCLRIYRLTGRRNFAIFCFLLNGIPFIGTVSGLVMFYEAGGFASLEKGPGHISQTVATAMVPAAQMCIASTLCYHLWQMRQSISFGQRAQALIDTIIIWTIESTVAASLVSIIELILAIRDPKRFGVDGVLRDTREGAFKLAAGIAQRSRTVPRPDRYAYTAEHHRFRILVSE